MKKVIVTSDTNPHISDLYQMLSDVMGKDVKKSVSISPLSYDGVMKKIEDKKLALRDMESDMKISKSKFFNCSIEEESGVKDVVFQISSDKLAIYFN